MLKTVVSLSVVMLLAGSVSRPYAVSEVFDHIWLYEDDAGETFGEKANGRSYGWSGDNTAGAYDRNDKNTLDDRYDRGVIMDGKDWDIEVANGTYTVLLVAGEPGFTDAVYRINVEGRTVVDGTPDPRNPFISGTVTVPVTDGRLTISSAAGSKNNRLAYVHITSPLFGAYSSRKYASPPLRIDVGNLGGFPFASSTGYVNDKQWVENSDFGYFSPTGEMKNTSTGITFKQLPIEPLYTTYLMGSFGYRIRVADGTYRLRLKFAEHRTDNTRRDNSDIIINGDTLIRDLDVVEAAGGQSKPFDTTVIVRAENELIELDFAYRASWYSPLLNGLELLPLNVSASERRRTARINLSVTGGTATFRQARPGDRVTLARLDGRRTANTVLRKGQTRCVLPALPPGLYVLRYRDASGGTVARTSVPVLSARPR